MYEAWRVLLGGCDRIYNSLIRYVLATIAFMALISFGIYGATLLLVEVLNLGDVDAIWHELARRTGATPLAARFTVNGLLQINFLLMFNTMIAGLAESTRLNLGAWYHARAYTFDDGGEEAPQARVRPLVGVVGSLMAAIVMIPVLAQPTITPLDMERRTIYERAANLFDGNAVASTPDAVAFVHHRLVEATLPKPGVGTREEHFDAAMLMWKKENEQLEAAFEKGLPATAPPNMNGPQPLMDRWDPIIWKAAGQDARRFAQIKAFMWVESTGRQFAISHTGCIGLMQFCSRTARSSTFRDVFGAGQVSACGCSRTSCRVPRDVQRDMEKGERRLIERHAGTYPCDLSDARFDARKSIEAGARYIANLDAEFGSNIYLMYIGYNSGPVIARRVWHRIGEDPKAGLHEIGEHLRAAMRPTYGKKSSRRARSLLSKHLPKLARAHVRYAKAAGSLDPNAPDPLLPVVAEVKPEPEPEVPRVDRTGDGVGEAPEADEKKVAKAGEEPEQKQEAQLTEGELASQGDATVCAVPQAPHALEVEVPFMKGIALNVERAALDTQEGEASVNTDFLEARWREGGLELHEAAREHPSPRHALVPPAPFKGRWLFGLEATSYVYSMNPHHGRYDELRTTLTAPVGQPADRFTRFTTLRDRLTKALGKPALEQLMVRGEDLRRPIARGDLDMDWRGQRARARSLWRAGDLSVELATASGSPDGKRAHVATLTIWSPSAEPNRLAAHAEWFDYAPLPMPSPSAKLLHTPGTRPHEGSAITPRSVTEDAAPSATTPAPAKKKVSKKAPKKTSKKKRTRRAPRQTPTFSSTRSRSIGTMF